MFTCMSKTTLSCGYKHYKLLCAETGKHMSDSMYSMVSTRELVEAVNSYNDVTLTTMTNLLISPPCDLTKFEFLWTLRNCISS